MNRPTRQLAALRSLFRTLYPSPMRLGSGRSYLGRSYLSHLPTSVAPLGNASLREAHNNAHTNAASEQTAHSRDSSVSMDRQQPKASSAALRSVTDEHLVIELQQITGHQPTAKLPRRSRKHYSRDALLALLEEASVRIQVLETELEIARGDSDQIPLLTDEWAGEWDSRELAAQTAPKPTRASEQT